MNIDEKIKQELENDAAEIDKIITEDPGLFSMIGNSFKGGLGRWVVIVNIVTLIASAFLAWSAYRFFIESETNGLIFWGIIFLVSLQVQVSLKMWLFMEMNRSSIIREVKRVEIMVAQLKD